MDKDYSSNGKSYIYLLMLDIHQNKNNIINTNNSTNYNNKDISELQQLLERGADANARISKMEEKRCIEEAIIMEENEIAKLLFKYGANININSPSALYLTIQKQNVELLETFLKEDRRVDWEVEDNESLSPLEYAASNKVEKNEKKLEIVKLLMKNGADISKRYPLVQACYAQDWTTAIYLLDKGGKVKETKEKRMKKGKEKK